MLPKILLIALAGGAGTLARYWLSGFMQKTASGQFPIGIAVVNTVGCLLFGLIWALLENRLTVTGQMRMVIFLGFFGGFTSLSTFIFETAQFLDDSQWLLAAGSMTLNTAVPLVCMFIGLAIGRWI